VLEEQSALADRLASVRAGIADAAAAASRDPSSVTTVVVTKFHEATLVRDLFALGVRDFGESRHQDAAPKIEQLADLDVTWHFVGQLQSKKARLVRQYVDVIHSVDRETLVGALAGSPSRDVFIQVNLTDDPSRGGAHPDDVPALADTVAAADGLTLLGLMAVAPLGAEPRRAFESVRRLSEGLRESWPEASALSMGMSGDYADAILEGATHLRIGTAITGKRLNHG
jgi:PLP dependent protein